MSGISARRIKTAITNIPNLFKGYNLYVNPEKMRLINKAFTSSKFIPKSFADLGGVWKVDAAYTLYTARTYNIQGTLVDTNFNPVAQAQLDKLQNVRTIQGDFGNDQTISKVGNPDMVFFFDVLLHQVNPNWDEILTKYSKITSCFVIYNQQITNYDNTIRLTDLSLEDYKKLVPTRSDDVYDYVFSHKNEINTEYNKPWKDIHNIWQWGITDNDLRNKMDKLGFKEIYFHNYGNFTKLNNFEDHGFIFIKKQM